MDLTLDQVNQIKGFIHSWIGNPQLELETSFGGKGVVDSTTFLQIAQRLRTKGFEVLPQQDYLNIIAPYQMDIRSPPIQMRLTLAGLGIIQTYCRDDTTDGKAFTAMIKDKTIPGMQVSTMDLSEYNIRFKMRREEELSPTDPRVQGLLAGWAEQPKAFRLIRRWSLKGKGVRVDMSMVRQTPSSDTGEFKWAKKFLDKNVANELARYEVEVELLHDEEYKKDPEKPLKVLIGGVGEVQRAIQKNTLLIKNSVVRDVKREYEKMVGTDKFRGVGPVTLEVKNMIDESKQEERDLSVPNIRRGYNVTDKADGLRSMGFVDSKGELFLLDQSMNVYRTGLQNIRCATSLVDGEWVTMREDGNPINHFLLFDIYYTKGGIDLSKEDIKMPFVHFDEKGAVDPKKSRYSQLKEWYKDWTNDTKTIAKGITDSNKLLIDTKNFIFGSPNNSSIFTQGCNAVLNTTRIYHTDGLIITSNVAPLPKNPGVRFNEQFKWKPSKENTVDFLIIYETDPNVPNTDRISIGIHPDNDVALRYKTMRLYVGSEKGGESDDPRAVIFQDQLHNQPLTKGPDAVRYRPMLFTPMEFSDTMANTCYRMVETDPDSLEEYTMTEDTKEPIPNRSIVEMRYAPDRDAGWRWIPARVRHDKTERLLRAVAKGGVIKYSGMMNDEGVANSVWNSIHEPITLSMIRTGNEEPNEEEIKDISTSRSTDIHRKYYERKATKQDLQAVKGLQDFHNKIIKNNILLGSALHTAPGEERNKCLLDLACGKGGDLYKWYSHRAKFVLGVDVAGENITNSRDGAYRRYLQLKKEKYNVPTIAFVIANSSKRLIDGTAGANAQESDLLRSIFGFFEPLGPIPRYIEQKMANQFHAGADVAACMFALHYFFETPVTLEGFLTNLKETVKVGGYFVGCCFDGDRIFRLLRAEEKGQSVSGYDGSMHLWSITKKYDQQNMQLLPADETSIGMPIDVDFISIGSTYTEYLVSFEFFKARMESIGFELLNAAELAEMKLENSTETFDITYERAIRVPPGGRPAGLFPMSDAVKQFSFLNRWFIFKRRGELPKIELQIPDEVVEEVVPLASDAAAQVEAKVEESAIPILEQVAPVIASKVVKNKRKTAVGDAAVAAVPAVAAVKKLTKETVLSIDVKGKPNRWLSPIAPFPIPDDTDASVTYPTTEHYLAAMRIKYTSEPPKPELVSMFTPNGTIHQEYYISPIGKAKLDSDKSFELLKEETDHIQAILMKKSPILVHHRIMLRDEVWDSMKDAHLKRAYLYRWQHDPVFQSIVKKATEEHKYILYTPPDTGIANSNRDKKALKAYLVARNKEMGGTLNEKTGVIAGENIIGKIIMEVSAE
jgi:hypothetical protein